MIKLNRDKELIWVRPQQFYVCCLMKFLTKNQIFLHFFHKPILLEGFSVVALELNWKREFKQGKSKSHPLLQSEAVKSLGSFIKRKLGQSKDKTTLYLQKRQVEKKHPVLLREYPKSCFQLIALSKVVRLYGAEIIASLPTPN